MKPIFKFWIFIESWKVFIALLCLYTEKQDTLIIFSLLILIISLIVNTIKMWPDLKKLINFSLIATDIYDRERLIRAKNTLLLLMLLDWLPFILLFTQAFLRYKYYKLDSKTNLIIKNISLQHMHIYNVV